MAASTADPSGDPTGSCSACATSWTADGVTRLTLFTASAGGSPTAAGTVDLEAGRLGPYRLVRLLGRGAMGTVMLAEPDDGGPPVAVKILIAPGLGNLLARFLREGELLQSMTHPNLVRVIAVRELSGLPCLVCEYLPGGTLRERLKAEGRLPWAQAARVMAEVLAGLEACHARGVVHRDLKPENVLFDASGTAKVADLGIAKQYGAEGPTLTGVGQLIGTPRYMSPEQVRGEAAVVASDIYAAGVLLYELLAGHAPFDGGSVLEILRKHADAPPPPLPPDVEAPPAALAMLERALAKRPEERPPSAKDFAQGLRGAGRPSGRTPVLRGTGRARVVEGASGRVSVPGKRRRSRIVRWTMRLGVAAGVGLAMAAGALRVARPDERPLEPQLVVEAGDLRVTWRTRSACRGAVTYRELDRGELLAAHEDAARTEHGIALGSLVPGRRYEVAIAAGGGTGWSTALAVPAGGRARLVADAQGLTVRVPACGASAGSLVCETARGPERDAGGEREGDELVFHTRRGPFDLAPGSRVEAALGPGVTARWPVGDLAALAGRLARGLDAFDPTGWMLQLVLSREYDPTLETQAVENFLGTRIVGNRTYHLRQSLLKKRFAELISRQSWGDDFADFRGLAGAWFAAPQVALDDKRRLYAGLLKLQWLDLLILSQHDHDLLGVAGLYDGFLRQRFSISDRPEPVTRQVLPGEIPVLERTGMFVPRGFVDWMQMRIFLSQEAGWRAAAGIPADADAPALKTAIPAQRSARITLPAAPPGGWRRLRARVARMAPMYALTVVFKPADAPALEVRLQQSGTPEFLNAMEEPFTATTRPWVGGAYRYWAEIITDIPAVLLPAGPVDVTVAYQSPPGVPLDRLTRLVRGACVRELNLSVVR